MKKKYRTSVVEPKFAILLVVHSNANKVIVFCRALHFKELDRAFAPCLPFPLSRLVLAVEAVQQTLLCVNQHLLHLSHI